MSLSTLIFLLAAGGIVLMLAELLLPTHGVLGVIGLLCLGGAIGVCFQVNRWLGMSVFLGAIVASPFVINFAMQIWARSPIGRRIILQNPVTPHAPSPVRVGQEGIAVTELRPMGECEFGDLRIETTSEIGMIPAGQRIRIVAISAGRPTVRPVDQLAHAHPSNA